jgi:EAL domain-containing protein (putative c-di-GMP-specific phosphodiesterase class I)
LGQSLGLDVIAEGVENAEHREFLLKNGCLRFQGYFFGQPVSSLEFEALLAQAPVDTA